MCDGIGASKLSEWEQLLMFYLSMCRRLYYYYIMRLRHEERAFWVDL